MSEAKPAPARRPVRDWATDFDHLSDEWAANQTEITAELRQRCPVAHTEMKVALQRWLARYPDFEPAGEVTWTIGVRGPRTVPLRVRPQPPPTRSGPGPAG